LTNFEPLINSKISFSLILFDLELVSFTIDDDGSVLNFTSCEFMRNNNNTVINNNCIVIVKSGSLIIE
jgi:hypothetical protein